MFKALPIILLATGTASALSPADAAASVSSKDRHFLAETARGAQYELTIAKLAADMATRADIKDYAQMIISAHESGKAKLHAVAQDNNITLPENMTKAQQAKVRRLSTLQGSTFDKAYVAEETRINQRDKTLEEKEIDTTSNQQIKDFVRSLHEDDVKHASAGRALERSGQ